MMFCRLHIKSEHFACSSSKVNTMAVLSCSVVSDSLRPHGVVHEAPLCMGILQAGILEWAVMPFSMGSSQPNLMSIALQVDSLLS